MEAALTLVVQIAALAAFSRLLARVLRPLGQPPVVAEMCAGLLVGPSLFGRLWPQAQAALFPEGSAALLAAAGKAAVLAHLFVAGLDARAALGGLRARAAGAVSLAGLSGPFLLGGALAVPLHAAGGWFGPGVGAGTASAYLGAAMAITAFPVLSRILRDRGLAGSPLGLLVLSAGAFDDLAAWAVVAVLSLDARPDASLLLAAAFALGLSVPRWERLERAARRADAALAPWLLPAFFAAAGLAVRLDFPAGSGATAAFAAILLAAFAGKTLPCALAARAAGLPVRDAWAAGALMNARGLMELVILGIGLERGIIAPPLYALMALMALATTFAAAPLCALARR